MPLRSVRLAFYVLLATDALAVLFSVWSAQHNLVWRADELRTIGLVALPGPAIFAVWWAYRLVLWLSSTGEDAPMNLATAASLLELEASLPSKVTHSSSRDGHVLVSHPRRQHR